MLNLLLVATTAFRMSLLRALAVLAPTCLHCNSHLQPYRRTLLLHMKTSLIYHCI